MKDIVEQPGPLLEREKSMANEKQLAILWQGARVWNRWREKNPETKIDLARAHLSEANLRGTNLAGAILSHAYLLRADLTDANLDIANLTYANLREADLTGATLIEANLTYATLAGTSIQGANLRGAILRDADLEHTILNEADLTAANLSGTYLTRSNFSAAIVGMTIFGDTDLSGTIGLENVRHNSPSRISTDVFALSKGIIPEVFLRGCGLSDWEIEVVKLYDPDLSNEEINDIQYRMYGFRATQALQIAPLFISYSHADCYFVDKIGDKLTQKGIRYWRDIHEMKSGRIERQIDRAIHQNPTVLLILSEHSIKSDWVEHEVRMARALEKEMGRDTLCPVALDDSWKSSRWPKRVMEQIMEYNILDFSEWKDDSKFEGMFRKLIDGLELFYKG